MAEPIECDTLDEAEEALKQGKTVSLGFRNITIREDDDGRTFIQYPNGEWGECFKMETIQ